MKFFLGSSLLIRQCKVPQNILERFSLRNRLHHYTTLHCHNDYTLFFHFLTDCNILNIKRNLTHWILIPPIYNRQRPQCKKWIGLYMCRLTTIDINLSIYEIIRHQKTITGNSTTFTIGRNSRRIGSSEDNDINLQYSIHWYCTTTFLERPRLVGSVHNNCRKLIPPCLQTIYTNWLSWATRLSSRKRHKLLWPVLWHCVEYFTWF